MRHVSNGCTNRSAWCGRAIAMVFLCAGIVAGLNESGGSAGASPQVTLTSVSVTPSSASVSVGASQAFTATGTFSDGSTRNVTSLLKWTSSNTSDATIQSAGQSEPGLAQGVAAGSVTISAAGQGKSGKATLNVISSSGGGNSTKIPLMDMTASQNYLGFAGGLYENSSDTVPTDHAAAGENIAATIQPLDSSGNPAASGKIVLASIGMSNAYDEFSVFVNDAVASTKVNKTTLVIANGADPSITAPCWTVATGIPPCATTQNQYDRVRDDVLVPLGVTEEQVEAVWLKEADSTPGVHGCGANQDSPCQSLCNASVTGCSNTVTMTEAIRYEAEIGEILRAAKTRWPNLKLAFLTTRIYAGYATTNLNPEPYAYEYGFSAKWLIQAQVEQVRTGYVDPTAGDLSYTSGTAPWVSWGPYIWANGDTPRSDGLIWCDGQSSAPCNREIDYQSDGTHPNAVGAGKVATMLMNFFLGSPYTARWFAAP